MKNRLINKIPPGYPFDKVWSAYWLGYITSAVWSLMFLVKYSEARSNLYMAEAGSKLIPGAVMPDFEKLIGASFYGFLIFAAACILFSYSFYRYFHKDSKSIYLMKRLPSRYELLSRCVTVPAAGALLSLASALIFLAVYFAIYMLATPQECLTPGQFEKLWRCVLC